MKQNRPNRPIDQWQQDLSMFYERRDQSTSTALLAMFLVAEVGNISRSVINRNDKNVPYSLVHAVSFLFALCSKNDVLLSECFWSKYPGVCPYCLHYPCMCNPLLADSLENSQARQQKIDLMAQKMSPEQITLKASQDFILNLYPTVTRIMSLEHHLLRLQGAIADASVLFESQPNSAKGLLADIFSFLLSLAGKFDVDIEDALCNLYVPKGQTELQFKLESPNEKQVKSQVNQLRIQWELCNSDDRRTKGKALENFAFAFFDLVPAFRVRRNVETDTSEFDLVISIDPEAKGGVYWNRYGPLIFVECKNRVATTGQGDISKMIGKAVVQGPGQSTTLIFFLSKSDFSNDALQQARYAYLKGYLIVPITDHDIEVALMDSHKADEYLRGLLDQTCMRSRSFIY